MPTSDRLVDAMTLCGLTGESWAAWRVVAKVLDAEPLTAEEMPLFEQCTGRSRPPTEPPAEGWIIKGRRCGGTRFIGACAVRAASRRYALAPGERAVVALAAADREQARVALGYATAPFRDAGELRGLVERRSSWEALRALVSRETRWGIDLRTGVSLEVHTNNYGKVRGRTFAFAGGDEASYWADEDGSNPASEVFAAIRPGLVTLHGQLVVPSTPHARRGPVWDAHARYFGKDDDRVLIWKAPTRTMNPLIPERIVLDALEQDESVARAEWLAEFRSDLESFVSSEAIVRVVVAGRTELPPAPSECDYCGFVDPSGGSGSDSMTLAVSHGEEPDDGRVIAVLDKVVEVRPPFSPEAVVAEFAETLRAYDCSEVTGDRYAGEWPREQFRRHGIEYRVSERSKSEIYAAFVPALNSGRVDLLDHPRLLAQLGALERRAGPSGRDTVDHPGRGHDDCCNVACGALLLVLDAAAIPPTTIGVLGGW